MRRITLFLIVSAIVSIPYCGFAWTETATFEGLTVGDTASGTTGFNYAGSATLISTTAHSGTRGAALNWVTSSDGWDLCQGNLSWGGDVESGGEVWYRAYVYYPSAWNWADTYKKIMRLRSNESGGASAGWLSIISFAGGEIILSNEVNPMSNPDALSGVDLLLGEWQSLEIYVYVHATDGIVRIWQNGVLAHEQTGAGTIPSGGHVGGSIYASYWNAPYSPSVQSEYVDDIIMTTDQPANQDADGNYMIGPTDWGGTSAGMTIQGNLQ